MRLYRLIVGVIPQTSMSDSEDSEDAGLSAAVCEERCQAFANVTGTDTALAMFYLQDRDWDVQRAVNAFFEEDNKNTDVGPRLLSALTSSEGSTSEPVPESKSAFDPEPHRVRILSWNIDGLDSTSIKTRTAEVCKIILKEAPDVVYLQEIVPVTLEQIRATCSAYRAIPGGKEGYFTAVLLRNSSVVYEGHDINDMFTSRMGRNILKVKAKVKQIPCWLVTSHFESTASYRDERKRQLKTAFQVMKDTPRGTTAIFGGDLNLRDKELAEIGGPPDGVLDLWEVTGRRPEARYTWDMSRNDNLEIPGRPKCRFDRLYVRHCAPQRALKPVYFELVGLERISSCRRYPSDHWGILAHFDKTS